MPVSRLSTCADATTWAPNVSPVPIPAPTFSAMHSPRELIVEPVGLDPDTLPRPIDWVQLYGNNNPVEIEIGIGKGTFITEQARARPDVNFFGIEWARW